MRRVVIAVIAVLVLGGIAFAAGVAPCEVAGAQPRCQVAIGPGPAEDTLPLVTVDGADAYESEGELRLTTLAVQDDLTFGVWLRSFTAPSIDLMPREQMYPDGADTEEVTEQNAMLMADSQLVATMAALETAGYELEGGGAVVAQLTDDAVTDELELGDVIIAIDSNEVQDSFTAVEYVQQAAPGDTLTFEVVAADDVEADNWDEVSSHEVEITLGEQPEDPDVAYVGVLLTTHMDLPIDVTIDAGAIGGPSAGMMFALSILDVLGEEDLTGGQVIAGTGTLDVEGNVGPIGGVRQKIVGATTPPPTFPPEAVFEPASVFLVPTANLEEAQSAPAGSELQIVPVDTLDQALEALEQLRAGETPEGAVLAGGN